MKKAFVLAILMVISLAGLAVAQTRPETSWEKRYTVAVRYREGKETSVNMLGTAVAPAVVGKAEVKRTVGRTRVRLKMDSLASPQGLGSFYTTYILWAVAPEGQADNLAELPVGKEVDIDVTTPFQTFGLIITAEPHSAVKLPSPTIVAENNLRKNTEGAIESSRIEYRGYPGRFYEAESIAPDYNTPLIVLGARRAVEVAKRAGARRFAEPELRKAEIDLAALEQVWIGDRKDEKRFGGMARDVMREGENAREVSIKHETEAGLVAERQDAANSIATAENRADKEKERADRYREALLRSQQDVAAAEHRVADAQNEADRARANEELSRAKAEEARLEAQDAKQEAQGARQEANEAKLDKRALEQKLYDQIAVILEIRRDTRGLIVNLSDVLFDFNKATLQTGAREKLSKLAGILLAYPGDYHLEVDGHTDSVGSDEYNLKLSDERANTVRYYLEQSGVASNRVVAVKGFGKTMPVADNSTPEGRQRNRRVEIVITDPAFELPRP